MEGSFEQLFLKVEKVNGKVIVFYATFIFFAFGGLLLTILVIELHSVVVVLAFEKAYLG